MNCSPCSEPRLLRQHAHPDAAEICDSPRMPGPVQTALLAARLPRMSDTQNKQWLWSDESSVVATVPRNVVDTGRAANVARGTSETPPFRDYLAATVCLLGTFPACTQSLLCLHARGTTRPPAWPSDCCRQQNEHYGRTPEPACGHDAQSVTTTFHPTPHLTSPRSSCKLTFTKFSTRTGTGFTVSHS
jgi:hypothetical protein